MIDLKKITRGKEQRPPRVLIYSFEGIGKAQPLDAMVLTPYGFVPMGDVEVGDEVIGVDGKSKEVTGVFPQGERPVFRVTMTDGAETECCGEHLWATTTVFETSKGESPSVRSLFEIRETLIYRSAVPGNARAPHDYPNHRVPVVAPIQFARGNALPLDPYLLGLLLGDGTLGGTSIEFHKPEPDLHERIAELLPTDDAVTQLEDGVRIRRKVMTAPRPKSVTWDSLHRLGLTGITSLEKFIPNEFLMSDIDSRTRLLRGLCDTDGHVIHTGRRVEISTSSSRLRDGILFLVRSLGGTITLREKIPTYSHKGERRTGAMSYRMVMYFANGLCPVSSKKHLAKWREDSHPYYRSIAEVEEVGVKECRCISVDANDGLYVTDDFIVTHNTRFAAGAPSPFFLDFDRGSYMYDAERTTPQTWSETKEWISAIGSGSVKCQTVVIDSITALEPISHAEIFPGTSIEQWEGGFGKGETYAVSQWREFLASLERLWLGGKTIVLVAHAVVKKFEDPSSAGYERFEVGVRPKLAGLLRQWVDYVLFAREEVLTVSRKGERPKATTTGTRWAYTRRTPAYDAKARGTLLFPEKILLSWDEFAGAIASEKARAEEMGATIEAMLTELADSSLTNQVRTWLKQNPDKLVEASQSLQAKLEAVRAQKLEDKAFGGPAAVATQATPNGS